MYFSVFICAAVLLQSKAVLKKSFLWINLRKEDNMDPCLSELCFPYRSPKPSDLPPASFSPQQPDQRSGRHDARAQEDAAAQNCQLVILQVTSQ